jgi:hypothetical protein
MLELSAIALLLTASVCFVYRIIEVHHRIMLTKELRKSHRLDDKLDDYTMDELEQFAHDYKRDILSEDIEENRNHEDTEIPTFCDGSAPGNGCTRE